MKISIFALSLLATPLTAQEISYRDDSSVVCSELAVSDATRMNCIGASARQCIEASGDERIIRALCVIEETKYWDGRLNAALRWLGEAYAAHDGGRQADSSTPYPRGQAMQEMQRVWMKYRDSRCLYETAQWGSMPDAGLAEVECLLRVTGEQALYLEAQPRDF